MGSSFFRACNGLIRAPLTIAFFFGTASLILPENSRQRCYADDSPQSSRVAFVGDDETLELTNLQKRFQVVADNVAPSVVAISAAVTAVDADDALRSDDLNVRKLDAILDRGTRTVGTGFIIDADGFILTNEHVVAEAQQLWITTDDRKVYPAIVVGSDPRADLAVLKIPGTRLQPVRFAPVNSVKRGEWAIALGNPYGLAAFGDMAMSVGVVSALDRNLTKLSARENRLYTNLIQTTAQINPGNSGGPLFDLEGNVIGINTAVVMPQKQVNGIGFAMPITDELLAKVRDLKEGREIVYAYMGVTVDNATPRQRREAGAAADVGVVVQSVEADTPASTASIQAGDIIMSIDGQLVFDSDQFVRVVGSRPVDREIPLELMRDRKTLNLNVTLKRRPHPSVAVTTPLQRLRWRGLLLGPVPGNWNIADDAKSAALPAGVLVLGVDSSSPLVKDGIASGAVITAIDGKPVNDLITLQQILNDTPAEQCRLTFAKPDEHIASTDQR